MARITIKDIRSNLGITETYDIVNAIRNSQGDSFKNYVPLATAENVAEVGAGIMLTQAIQNDFITSLVDRIGLVVIKSASLSNQLAKFKKGSMPLGRTIEEIFVDITKGKKYNAEDSETTVFKRTIPNVKTLFHERNRQDYYSQTIQDDSLKTAFVSWSNFEGFLSGIINAIYNSAEVEEFEYMKLLIDNYHSKGLFKVIPIEEPTNETTSRAFIKKLRATVGRMSLTSGSRDYNSLAVRTRTDVSDMHLIITADLQAEIDVDVLARAFNMDKTNFLGNITVIDEFSSPGLEAVLVDREWFMVYDTLHKMETIRNPKGLYWNYFYHVWQILSVSRFSNAVAFVSGAVPKVTSVIVDPTIVEIKQGNTFDFTAYVRNTDGIERDIDWTVEGLSGTTLTGTTIDDTGKITVGATQTGELSVKASVDISEAKDGSKLVTGESIVTVTPSF